MKFFHLSDLHLGRRLYEYSLIEDQAHILRQILALVDAEQPDALLLCGDIYDKAVPSLEAVELFDWFLNQLAARNSRVLIISGNHDSAARLAFGGSLMTGRGVHISPVYNGHCEPLVLRDEQGETAFFSLPFLKPAQMRRFFPDEEPESYTDALALAIREMDLRAERRNVLLCHQLVTGAARCESETISIGGLDNVDPTVFAPFDYVALGHIHSPQQVAGDARLRYCGTPLCYSFSEAGQQKSLTVVELGEKGSLSVRTLPLVPLRAMRKLRGSYLELTDRSRYAGTATDDYLQITLTDEQDIPNALARLRVIYPNLMQLLYDNIRTRSVGELAPAAQQQSPLALLEQFYTQQNGQPMNEQQRQLSRRLLQQIFEEERQ